MEGIIGIVEGLNPTLIRMKLQSFNQHPQKPPKAKAKAKPAPAPGGKPDKPPQAAPAKS
jgi:hypothetical protein